MGELLCKWTIKSYLNCFRKYPDYFSPKIKYLWISTVLFYDSLKIQGSQDIPEESFNMQEKDNEIKEIISEMEQLKEQLKAKESALLRSEKEKLSLSERLQESHQEMKSIAKERDDLQQLQEALQSQSDQIKENMREIAAKVGYIFFLMYVYVCVFN